MLIPPYIAAVLRAIDAHDFPNVISLSDAKHQNYEV